MKDIIQKLTKEGRINVPDEIVQDMGLRPHDYIIFKISEDKKSITIHRVKIVIDQ